MQKKQIKIKNNFKNLKNPFFNFSILGHNLL
jgi:hypothetical protein